MSPPQSPEAQVETMSGSLTSPSDSFAANSLMLCPSNASSSSSSAEHARISAYEPGVVRGHVAHASMTDLADRGSPLRPLKWRSAADPCTIPPALPESPEILVQPAKVGVAVPRCGTRPPGHGLSLGPLSPLSGPPLSHASRDSRDSFNSRGSRASRNSRDSYTSVHSRESRDSDSPIPPAPLPSVLPHRPLPPPPIGLGRAQFSSSTPSLVSPPPNAPPRPPRAQPPPPIHAQPLPPVPRRHGAHGSLGNNAGPVHTLGRQLPHTLTESLELLVQVKEHCLELERLTSVPEEPTSPDMPTRLKPAQPSWPPQRRSSFNAATSVPAAGGIRRATDPSVSYTQTTSFVSRMNRTSSSSDSSELSTTSGEWPETPSSGTFALSPSWAAASASVPAFNKPLESLVTASYPDSPGAKARRRAVKAMRSCTQLHAAPGDMPSLAKVMYAAELDVVSEDGQAVPFGELIDAPGHTRTVVVFVRHWLSPSCAAYLRALIAQLTPPLLARSRARVVVIGLGAASMIKGFRQQLQCPFAVYTDPTRRLHDVLGLAPRALSSAKSEYSASGLKHAGAMLLGAARMQSMRAGNRSQLGGEFVFEGTERVLLAHRMVSGADHAPLKAVVDAIGVPTRPERPSTRAPSVPLTTAPAAAPSAPAPYTPVQPLCVQRRSSMYTSGFTASLKAPFKTPYASRSCTALAEAPSPFRAPPSTSQATAPSHAPVPTSLPPPHPAPMSLAFPMPPTAQRHSPLENMPWGQQRSRSRQGSSGASSSSSALPYLTHSSITTTAASHTSHAHTHHAHVHAHAQAAHSKYTPTPGRVAIVHPEDIDRVTGELQELCSRRAANMV